MSETKFTKGEWIINDNPKEYLITNETGFGICDTVLHDAIDGHNAYLIKTAPKLYAEVESDIEFLTGLMSEMGSRNRNALIEIINLKKKLLAEARGEL